MKTVLRSSRSFACRRIIPLAHHRAYWTALWLASLVWGAEAAAQTNSRAVLPIVIPPPPPLAITNLTNLPVSTTNVPLTLSNAPAGITNKPPASTNTPAVSTNKPPPATNTPAPARTGTNVTELNETTVIGRATGARSEIAPSGATSYGFTSEQLAAIPQGEQASFSQVLLRAPGVAEDSLGQVHLRGEHANIQYRVDGVLLPEGITGFGSEIDTRFVQSMNLMTGTLPAEYGFRTAGVVDIQTKSGAFNQGGSATMYGGSYDTLSPSFSLGGSQGKLNYFVDASFLHNGIGIENPNPTSVPQHDDTDQFKGFSYLSYTMDETSRLTAMASGYSGTFQIPINLSATPTADPAVPAQPLNTLDDNQNENGYYGVVAYQKTAGDFNMLLAGYGRESAAHYYPNNVNASMDYNNDVATDEKRQLFSGGLQLDCSYELNGNHILRGGGSFLEEYVGANTSTTVITNSTDTIGTIPQDNRSRAQFYDLYLEDEWKILPRLTFNYGCRFDVYSSTYDFETQFCPRFNAVYKATDSTTLHAGYAHYFTPPPLENVPAGDITAFNGTSAESQVGYGSTVQAERSDYYDGGITQTILPGWQVGVDGYYKQAKNQLDDGFFGQSLILSAFNYNLGRIHGVEFSTSYTTNDFSVYANVAWARAQGKGAATAQYLWGDQTTVNYVNNNWIGLDHDQRLTGSFGTSYTLKETSKMSTLFSVDALYGSGLRQDGYIIPGFNPNQDPIPNGSTVPPYYTVGLGIEHDMKLSVKKILKARFDIVNLTDHIYQLRSGSGVGVNAPQYGERRGFFGSLSFVF
jgi:hypothetical protein